MKEKILKSLLVIALLLGVQTSGMVAFANEDSPREVEPEWWWNKEKEDDEKYRNLEGGTEKQERAARQQPVSNIVLQQQYPETVILQGPTTENKIALTFDDGPDPRYTEQVLDILAEYNVPATFFVMGSRAIAFPEMVERMDAEGHIVGNHTYWHPNLVEKGDIPTLEREIERTEDVLNDIVGYRTSLFRAPYGFLYGELVEKVAEMNYSVIVWSVDSLDWQEDPPAVIASNVLDNVHPGAIILMHDGGDWDADRTNTIESLRQIIPTLQEQGYEFVTVPNLLNIPYQK
ncbi:polysaccharide deacetylase family protein [Bacillus sp. FJAT-45350]|uniref:polysaccharide deacetylase family protein n=1 Tax=Bacillus sp. FJAT-45350 TaxID=2011014 RepID=UPI000BB825C2|nr:polysaccharide deacetylase family protein [Bacillus sp. FJAT-45350]